MRREFHVRFCEGGGAQFPSATRLVVCARWMGPRVVGWIEGMLEQTLQLTVNRTKTRVVRLQETGAHVDFLGFTARFLKDRHGREHRYLAVGPSARASPRARDHVRSLVGSGFAGSLRDTVVAVNAYLRAWRPYFAYGYPRAAFRALNHFIRERLWRFLRHRSQRRSRPFRRGETTYAGLARYGLCAL